ncbi:urease subunit beta [Nonomuraea sp. NBC_01738]|nr:urease subunit beta [Nonomuraea sp. NBC_01738]
MGPAPAEGPGAVRLGTGDVALNEGRPRGVVRVTNHGERTVFVSSHFPLSEVNSALSFDRDPAGLRLAIPAGTATGFPPGETTEIEVITA